MALTVTDWLYDVAQRTARTWDHDEPSIRRDCAFAVNPNSLSIGFPTTDAVVATVPEASGFCTEHRDETTRNEFAICLGPTDGELVSTKIFPRSQRIRFDTLTEVPLHVGAQGGFPQSTRTAVNKQYKLLLAEIELLDLNRVENLLDHLQLGEVIAAADRAQRRIELCGFEIALSEEVAHELIPRVFEIELQLGPAVEFHVAAHEVRLEQGHAATDVDADQVWINHTFS